MNLDDQKEVERIAKQVLNKSFSKRIGDTPTDALQLVNKAYVDNNSGVHAGSVRSNVATSFFPSGWSVSKTGTGRYLITHNLGTTNYSVAYTLIGSFLVTIANITTKSANSFVIEFYNQTAATTWTNTDTDFDFIVS